MFQGPLMLSQPRQRPGHERIAGVTKHPVAALLRHRQRGLGGSHGLRVFAGDKADHGKGRVNHGFSVLIAACLGHFQDLVEFSGTAGVIAQTGPANGAVQAGEQQLVMVLRCLEKGYGSFQEVVGLGKLALQDQNAVQ